MTMTDTTTKEGAPGGEEPTLEEALAKAEKTAASAKRVVNRAVKEEEEATSREQ